MTTANEFQGALYRTTNEMLTAIASEFLSAGGLNSLEDQREALAAESDADLAAECISEWGLGEPFGAEIDDYDDEGHVISTRARSHMQVSDYTADELAAAFADIRARYGAQES